MHEPDKYPATCDENAESIQQDQEPEHSIEDSTALNLASDWDSEQVLSRSSRSRSSDSQTHCQSCSIELTSVYSQSTPPFTVFSRLKAEILYACAVCSSSIHTYTAFFPATTCDADGAASPLHLFSRSSLRPNILIRRQNSGLTSETSSQAQIACRTTGFPCRMREE